MPWALVVTATLIAASAGARPVEVRGQVVDEEGAGLGGVTVFVLDARTGTITTRIVSDADGAFEVTIVGRRRQRFEAGSTEWALVRSETVGPRQIRLVMRPQPGPRPAGRGEVLVAGDGAPERIAGRVVDETGAGVRGVRLTMTDPRGGVTVMDSDASGRFAGAVRPGRCTLLVFAPGLRLQALEQVEPNRWQLTLAIAAAPETVRVQAAPWEDPDNPSAPERARLAFEGRPISGQPRVSPTLADLQASRSGLPDDRLHPVARQPVGAYCVRSSHCSQLSGETVCCGGGGELADEYLWAGGIAGTCRPVHDCAGAQKFRHPPR